MWRGGLRLLVAATLANGLANGGLAVHAAGTSEWQRLPNDPLGANGALATAGPANSLQVMARNLGIGRQALQSYDLSTRRWMLGPAVPVQPIALTAAGNTIYVVAGSGSARTTGSYIYAYTPGTHGVSASGYSDCPHNGGSAAAGTDGRIYVVAGAEGGPDSCAEAYAPSTHRWKRLTNMPVPELLPASTRGIDGCIYVLGGGTLRPDSHQYVGRVTATAQVYDPRTGHWKLVAPMPTARMALAAVTSRDGRIYAIGGTTTPLGFVNGQQPTALRTVEIYDPRTGRWSTGPNLGVARYDLGAALAADGRIYAVGAWDTNAVETLRVAPAAAP